MKIDRSVPSAGAIHEERSSYYGRSPIKPPSWSMLIPNYIFAGGFSGASSVLALAARARKNDALAERLIYGAAAGTLVSMYCLIKDLGRPERFMKMLRVFKPTSPMNMGVYIVSAYGGAAIGAAASQATGILPKAGRAFEGMAAVLGPAMSVYTGVLLADTAVPTWNEGRRTLPSLFAASSATAAGACGMMVADPRDAATARCFALLGAAGIIIASKRIEHEVGPALAETFNVRDAKAYKSAAMALTVAGMGLTLLARRSRPWARLAGALLFGGAFCEKWAAYRAGYISAEEAKYVLALQRSRLEANGGKPSRLHDNRLNGSTNGELTSHESKDPEGALANGRAQSLL